MIKRIWCFIWGHKWLYISRYYPNRICLKCGKVQLFDDTLDNEMGIVNLVLRNLRNG